MLTVPYVSVAEFRQHPTFLDTGNLVPAGTQAAQDAALYNALLTASTWADQHLYGHDGTIAAHVRVENARCRTDRFGRLRYHPEHAPVLSVTSLSAGSDLTSQTVIAAPQAWTEQDGRILVAYLAGATGAASLDSRFQFGSPVAYGELLTTWTYVAGYPATQLTAAAPAGVGAVTVVDPTGIATGSVLRLWTPGLEEAVKVAAVAGATLTLTSTLVNAHNVGDSIQGLPPTIREAVINKAICELLRPNTSTQQQSASGMSMTSTGKDPARAAGGGYHDKACALLRPFQRIR